MNYIYLFVEGETALSADGVRQDFNCQQYIVKYVIISM